MKTVRALLAPVFFAGALGLLLSTPSGSLRAEMGRVAENLRGEKVLLPPSAPTADRLTLVSFDTIAPEGGVIAALAFYDDPETRRAVDYLELYDGTGSLLLVSWVDRFSIRRIAMDVGLFREGTSRLEGVLVLLQEGVLL